MKLSQWLATLSTARERYAACAERGLTKAETARELGVTRAAVCAFARNTGTAFKGRAATGRPYGPGPRGPQSEEQRAAISAGSKRAWETRISGLKTILNPREEADYRFLRRNGYRRAEAMRAIGRPDLIPEAGA